MPGEGMSIEDCRKAQRECSKAVHEHIEDHRREMKEDIAAIREAVQEIDRNVARIKGFLGINGNQPHQHARKDNGDKPHEHQRATDGTTVTLPKWFVWAMLVVFAVALILAAFAGPHGVEHAVTVIPTVPRP